MEKRYIASSLAILAVSVYRRTSWSRDEIDDDRIIVPLSLMVRGLCQSDENAAKLIDILKQKQYDTPPYFSLLIR